MDHNRHQYLEECLGKDGDGIDLSTTVPTICKGSTNSAITHITAFELAEFCSFQLQTTLKSDISVYLTLAPFVEIKSIESPYDEVLKWICHARQPFSAVEDD